jgi:hypothetical protein
MEMHATRKTKRRADVTTYITEITLQKCGPGSSVGIATELRTGRSGDRNQAGARFSAPVQTGPGVHPAYSTMYA